MSDVKTGIGKETLAGIGAGLVQTVLFQPYDRALYRYVVKRKPMTNMTNWRNMYQGMNNAVFNRMISYGLYYTMIDEFRNRFQSHGFGEVSTTILTGMSVGTSCSILLNPLSAIKYSSWNRKGLGQFETARRMYRNNGVYGFTTGLGCTISRDSVFTTIYSGTQEWIKKQNYDPLTYFAASNANVFCSSLVSSFPNFLRNRKFQSIDPKHPRPTIDDPLNRRCIITRQPVRKPISIGTIIRQFSKELAAEDTALAKVRLVQQQFCIGWGTLRVCLGISCGRMIYDYFMTQLEDF